MSYEFDRLKAQKDRILADQQSRTSDVVAIPRINDLILSLKQQLELERAKVIVKDKALRYLTAEARAYIGVNCGCAGVTNRRCLELRINEALAALQAPEVKS